MASLQILRKRYKSIQSTAEMAAAMKTASTVKYARITRMLSAIGAYSQACSEALSLFGTNLLTRKTESVKKQNCLVVFSSSRGFCGGFNSELLRFFENQMEEEAEKPLLIVQGQKAVAFCNAKGYEFQPLEFEDIPGYKDAETLTARLFEIYASGEADHIDLICQRFDNMMKQTPVRETILPLNEGTGSAENRELLCLPDRETAEQAPAMYCLVNSIYRIMLGHCAGAQAATTIAMRNACDNAEKSLEKLEILINRIRQAEVTNSVIETSASMVSSQ